MNYILVDTNVIIRRLRGALNDTVWNAMLASRAPVISPITWHELRRGIRPGSPWESSIDNCPAPLIEPPSEADWIESADLIRKLFWKTHKGLALGRLQNDVLIAVTAKRMGAILWSKDGDMRTLCHELGVQLVVD